MIDFENLPRWIYASASKAISSNADSAITFFEGTDKDTEPQEGAEFRFDGPRLTEWSKGYFEVWVSINILVQTAMNDEDFHQKYRVIGKIINALRQSFSVFRFGDGVDDDDTLVGCMMLIQDKNNRLQVNHFGQISPSLRLEHATVEAHYHMFLQE